MAARPLDVPQADDLLGASAAEVRRHFGEPSLRRREGRAELWTYATSACALLIVLLGEGERLAVGHVETGEEDASPARLAACLKATARARQGAVPTS